MVGNEGLDVSKPSLSASDCAADINCPKEVKGGTGGSAGAGGRAGLYVLARERERFALGADWENSYGGFVLKVHTSPRR